MRPGAMSWYRGLIILARRGGSPTAESPREAALFLLRHLRMNDAVTGGHPLRAARAEMAVVAEAVAMLHRAVDHVRHGLESAVRMRRESRRRSRPGMSEWNLVEQEERIEHGQRARSERAVELDARAFEGGLGADELGYRALARQRCWQRSPSRRFGVLGSAARMERCSRGNSQKYLAPEKISRRHAGKISPSHGGCFRGFRSLARRFLRLEPSAVLRRRHTDRTLEGAVEVRNRDESRLLSSS